MSWSVFQNQESMFFKSSTSDKYLYVSLQETFVQCLQCTGYHAKCLGHTSKVIHGLSALEELGKQSLFLTSFYSHP